MNKYRWSLLFGAALACCLSRPCMAGATGETAQEQTVGRYQVFEVLLTTDESFGNPFGEAKVSAEFTSPGGAKTTVAGFYFGRDEWMVRFAPDQVGLWSYEARLVGKKDTVSVSGSVRCVASDRHGFLRISKKNRFRFEYDDGTPFYPIGIQTCGYFQVGFDGPPRDQGWRKLPAAQWCEAFDGAVNLIRWQLGAGTKRGCPLALIPEGGPADRYDTDLAAKMDNLLRLQRKHGFSHIMILMQDISLWGGSETVFGDSRDLVEYKSLKAKNLPLQEQFIRYVVARYGCFVDIWELFNEDSYAPNDYLAHLAGVVREADPYHHPITTNYARPDQDWCEIVTWHEYMGMPANQVDIHVANEIGKLKSYGKLVQNTEFGNQGWLSNYDPIKWRVAVWTAFMNESGILFWGMSGGKTKGGRPYRGNANAYIGSESRQYFRVLNEFTRDMPIDMRPIASGYTEHNDFRIYALSNGAVTAVYMHHFSDHSKELRFRHRLFLQTGPGKFRVTWINPADGKVVLTDRVSTVQHYLILKKVPPMKIDLACRIDRID